MFSHITLGTNDWQRARPFWLAVMETLGHPVMFEREGGIAFGEPTGPKTFIGPPFDGNSAQPGNGVHAAFLENPTPRWTRFMPQRWPMAAPKKVRRDRSRNITSTIMEPMCAIPTATNCRRSVTHRTAAQQPDQAAKAATGRAAPNSPLVLDPPCGLA